jgi:hypothetical protein
MGWLDAALDIGGAVAGLWASDKESDAIKDAAKDQAAIVQSDAKANAELSRYDAAVVRSEASETFKAYQIQLSRAFRIMNARLGSQRTQLAKSGVVSDTGSGVKLQQETLKESYKDIEILRYNGNKAVDRINDLAKRYDMLAEKGLKESAVYASSILDAASNKAEATIMSGWTDFGKNVSEIGTSYGWWE